MAADRGSFGQLGFVLAAVGSAVGLGNIWKFPYITFANDGGSFVLIYLVAILLIGAPIMVAEILIGRHTQLSPVGAFLSLAREAKTSRYWSIIGFAGVIGGAVLLSYYAIIAGWTVYYFGRCISWSLNGFNLEGAQLGEEFGAYLANPGSQITFQAMFLGITGLVVVLGVKAGIERVTKILMPVLGVMLVVLALNSLRSPGFGEAITFLFHVGPIDADGVLEAVGHSFFTLSLGMGAMLTYGSYVGKSSSIPRAAIMICIFDTVVAILACIIMFSIIFSVPEAERAGTFSKSATILFTTLPRMFYAMPLGGLLAPFFYLLVAFAALTSTISLLEVAVSYFVDTIGWGRRKAAGLVSLGIFLIGVPAALSLGGNETMSNMSLGFLPEGVVGVFGIYDYTVSNWFLPVGGLLIAVFTGWILKDVLKKNEIELGHGTWGLYPVWSFLLKFVAPLAILWIIIAVIGGRSFA